MPSTTTAVSSNAAFSSATTEIPELVGHFSTFLVRILGLADSHAAGLMTSIEGWLRDLTEEGVEPNPGPTQRRNPLDSLEKAGTLSPDGKAWLTQILDPFHDQEIEPIGYPDTDGSRTIVRCFNQSATISQPSGQSTGTWDAHIFSLPETVDQFYNFYPAQTANAGTAAATPQIVTAAPAAVQFGLINAVIGATPLATWGVPTATGSVVPNNTVLANINAFQSSPSRIVGLGFEVINTTADINLQGLVTYYRMPQSRTLTWQAVQFNNATPSMALLAPAIQSKLPPNTVSQALQLANGTQRKAAEGGYCVVPLNDVSNPLGEAVAMNRYFTSSDATMLNNSFSLQNQGTTAPTNLAITGTQQFSHAINFDTAGMFFTGLSLSTTLQVNIKIFVEMAPIASDVNFTPLARAAPLYDPMAFELYSAALSVLPPGCMLKENPAGEWFAEIIKSIRDNAPWIGKFLGTAGVPYAENASKVVANIARMSLGQKKQQSAPKQQKKKAVQASRTTSKALQPTKVGNSLFGGLSKQQIAHIRSQLG